MKTILKFTTLTAVLLILAGGIFSACEKTDDPFKAIIGKWEQVETRFLFPEPNSQPHEPTGYFEFRQDGTVVWYDYATKQYTYEGTYWIEPTKYDGRPIYNPMNERTVWLLSFQSDPEFYHRFNNYLVFYSKNRIGLSIADISSQNPSTGIYSRKK